MRSGPSSPKLSSASASLEVIKCIIWYKLKRCSWECSSGFPTLIKHLRMEVLNCHEIHLLLEPSSCLGRSKLIILQPVLTNCFSSAMTDVSLADVFQTPLCKHYFLNTSSYQRKKSSEPLHHQRNNFPVSHMHQTLSWHCLVQLQVFTQWTSQSTTTRSINDFHVPLISGKYRWISQSSQLSGTSGAHSMLIHC